MLARIHIDISNPLNWELEEKLFKACNGFEVNDQSLILWVIQDLDYIVSLLRDNKVTFMLHNIS
ncbi:MAG TPA: hypothetical protein VD908_21605 [Cytophagales bacterium]|nr:hypothetical protein [Cytophagales bacterium]